MEVSNYCQNCLIARERETENSKLIDFKLTLTKFGSFSCQQMNDHIIISACVKTWKQF